MSKAPAPTAIRLLRCCHTAVTWAGDKARSMKKTLMVAGLAAALGGAALAEWQTD